MLRGATSLAPAACPSPPCSPSWIASATVAGSAPSTTPPVAPRRPSPGSGPGPEQRADLLADAAHLVVGAHARAADGAQLVQRLGRAGQHLLERVHQIFLR